MSSDPFQDGQIAYLASRAGFKGQDLVIAVAVAIAESSGDAHSENPSTATGLWQVRYSAHTNLVPNQTALLDPLTNAKAAFSVFQGSGWGAWTTYTKGTYKQYLPRAEQAVANQSPPSWKQITGSNPIGNSIPGADAVDNYFSHSGVVETANSAGNAATTVVKDTFDTATAIPDFIGKLSSEGTWIRVAEIVGGIVAVLLGVTIAAKGMK